MTLKELLQVVSPVEKIKIVDFDTNETLFDNIYKIELEALAGVSEVTVDDYKVMTIGSLLDWNRNTIYITIIVRKVVCNYGE